MNSQIFISSFFITLSLHHFLYFLHEYKSSNHYIIEVDISPADVSAENCRNFGMKIWLDFRKFSCTEETERDGTFLDALSLKSHSSSTFHPVGITGKTVSRVLINKAAQTYSCSSGSPAHGSGPLVVSSKQESSQKRGTNNKLTEFCLNLVKKVKSGSQLTEAGWVTSMLMSLVLKANRVRHEP